MKQRSEFVVSVYHAGENSTMTYTVRKVARKYALCEAILKYPNAQYIHVSGALS